MPVYPPQLRRCNAANALPCNTIGRMLRAARRCAEPTGHDHHRAFLCHGPTARCTPPPACPSVAARATNGQPKAPTAGHPTRPAPQRVNASRSTPWRLPSAFAAVRRHGSSLPYRHRAAQRCHLRRVSGFSAKRMTAMARVAARCRRHGARRWPLRMKTAPDLLRENFLYWYPGSSELSRHVSVLWG